MLAPAEFTKLSTWCREHALRGSSTTNEDGLPEFRLENDNGDTIFKHLVLFHREGQFHLIDDKGNTLASSSSLQSVLDALGGGVAEKPRQRDPAWKMFSSSLASFLFSV
jgi:hypothetical protein